MTLTPFVRHTGKCAALARANVDTDQIIPKQFLKRVERTGFGPALFHDWRFRPDGSENPEFELNQPEAAGATILIAGANFGCGSSREHAPWALMDYGFRCLIAPSFADIFFNNCFKNGLLPVVLSEAEVDRLFYECASFPGFKLVVNLESQSVSTTHGVQTMRFEIDAFRKYSLLNGLDEIGLTLRHADKIRAFEARRKAQFPWYF